MRLDLPPPQSAKSPIVTGSCNGSVTTERTSSAWTRKPRRSISVSLSGHIFLSLSMPTACVYPRLRSQRIPLISSRLIGIGILHISRDGCRSELFGHRLEDAAPSRLRVCPHRRLCRSSGYSAVGSVHRFSHLAPSDFLRPALPDQITLVANGHNLTFSQHV
jgi:hypothetical protein